MIDTEFDYFYYSPKLKDYDGDNVHALASTGTAQKLSQSFLPSHSMEGSPMYSVIVLMAMTGSVETVDRGGCRGCRGCHGCYGSCSGGCYGGRCHGCYGGYYHSCHGCYGGCCGGVIITPKGGEPKGGEKGTKTGALEYQPNTIAVGSGARIEIKLPTAGQVVIDDYTVPNSSDTHTYITAPLSNGEKRNITL